jgi:hypothetical protein
MGYPDFSSGEVLTSSDMDRIGLWRISKTTATGSSAVQIDNIFTSDFTNYRIIFTGVTNKTSVADLSFRFVDGTTPSASALYSAHLNYAVNTGGWYFYYQSAITNGTAGYGGDKAGGFMLDIFQPKEATITSYISNSTAWATTTNGAMFVSGTYFDTTAFEGIQFFQPSQTITGTFTVYGYNKNS